jgi:hypothetical protein
LASAVLCCFAELVEKRERLEAETEGGKDKEKTKSVTALQA